MTDPNRAFRLKKKRKIPKVRTSVVMILCTATNCHHKTIVSRDHWQSTKEIVCSNCGSTNSWETL